MTEEGKLDLKVSDETQKQIDGLLDRLGSTMGGGYPGATPQVERIVAPVTSETTSLKSAEGLNAARSRAVSGGESSSGTPELCLLVDSGELRYGYVNVTWI